MKFRLGDITNIYDDANGLVLSHQDFNKKYGADTSTCINDTEEQFLRDDIHSSNFYVSEKISFVTEFRIHYFEGSPSKDMVIGIRTGCATNSKDERTNTIIDHKTAASFGVTRDIFGKLKEFGDSTPFCMLSFDVYIQKDGSWGLFEYSTQFGFYYDGVTLKKLGDQMGRAIKHNLNNQK